MRYMAVRHYALPIRGVFRIARGEKTVSNAVEVTLTEGEESGRAECIPYAHYGESVESVMEQITALRKEVEAGLSIEALQEALPPGAARNALDCAMWSLRSKLSGHAIAEYAGLPRLAPVTTAFTLSLDTPEAMANAAQRNADLPILKLKLNGRDDIARVEAVRAAAPNARLIADANESWTPQHLDTHLPRFAELGIELLEQPLPAGRDAALRGLNSPVPLAADETCRSLASLNDIVGKYSFATIKLDKTGGLTEALALITAARAAGLRIMVGSMVSSSLSVGPGLVIAQFAEFLHLDGPLLLAEDCEPGYQYHTGRLDPDPHVWPV
jgi:L-alanine-DL-glutamate epimerase-like enolase superfamily enzyme